MSVILVKEIWTDREGVLASQEDTDIRNFHVKTNSLYDNAKTIENSGLIPSRFSVHPTRPSIFAEKIECKQHPKSGFWWRVKISYRNITTGLPSLPVREFQPDPLLRKAIITGHSVIAHQVLNRAFPLAPDISVDGGVTLSYLTEGGMKDIGGPYAQALGPDKVFIQSSSGDYVTGFQHDKFEFVWHVKYNVFPLPLWILSYANKYNDDTVIIQGRIHRRRTLCLKGIQVSDLQEERNNLIGSQLFFTVSFDLHFNPDSWVRPIEDRAEYRQTAAGKMVKILDERGDPVSKPVFLNGAGDKLFPFSPEKVKYGWWLPDEEMYFGVFPLNPWNL